MFWRTDLSSCLYRSFFVERFVLAIHNGAAALLQGLALGLLSNQQLETLTEQRYLRKFSSYAEESHVTSGLFLWEREAIRRYFPGSGRIIVAAAGAGREMLALAHAGYVVDGFDCCAPLVKAAQLELKKHGVNAKLELVPPSSVPGWNDRFDGVLVGFSGYMYIPGRSRRIRFLRELCRFLNPGAPLMLSFTEGTQGRRRTWTARIGTAMRSLRRAEPVEEGDWITGGFQHHFLREQILSEMSEAGMELVYYSGGTCYGHAVGLVREKALVNIGF